MVKPVPADFLRCPELVLASAHNQEIGMASPEFREIPHEPGLGGFLLTITTYFGMDFRTLWHFVS